MQYTIKCLILTRATICPLIILSHIISFLNISSILSGFCIQIHIKQTFLKIFLFCKKETQIKYHFAFFPLKFLQKSPSLHKYLIQILRMALIVPLKEVVSFLV